MRLRIIHKLALGFMLVLTITGILSISAYYGLSSYRTSNQLTEYQLVQQDLLRNLEKAFSEFEKNFWGIPTQGNSNFLSDSNALREQRLQDLNRINTLIDRYEEGLLNSGDLYFSADGFAQQEGHVRTLRNRSQYLQDAIEKKSTVAQANMPTTPIALATSMEDHWLREFAVALDRLRGSLTLEVTRYVENDRSNIRTTLAVVIGATIFVVALLLVLVWLGYRAFFHPIRDLHRGVTKLAQGKFDSRVKLETGDEMEELGKAFNDMADHIQSIYRELNEKVEERSRQLIRTERLASVGHLAAGVAHEINNPLASIAFCGESLENRLGKTVDAETKEGEIVFNYLKMIQNEAFRCKGITEKLLDFSRAGEPERIAMDVVSLIRDVMEMVRQIGRAKTKQIVFQPTGPVVVEANPQEMKQVLLNLLVNALESVEENGTVTINVRTNQDEIEILVTDNGCGMTKDVLDNLFEPFFTRSRSGKGNGLGLSISHLIVSQHGGTITASSDGLGKGSQFSVTLPSKKRTNEKREETNTIRIAA